jgi:hypothetical protein
MAWNSFVSDCGSIFEGVRTARHGQHGERLARRLGSGLSVLSGGQAERGRSDQDHRRRSLHGRFFSTLWFIHTPKIPSHASGMSAEPGQANDLE